ncbi:outer membrane protein W [Elusimicrobium posterum]|uniref:outer membrane beta-barrel protein n=1 Tax=Elusimicrobium posterum TaxID=3116653 RepID=UPI003C73D164
MKHKFIIMFAFMMAFPSFATEYVAGDIVAGMRLNTAYPLLGLWKGEFDVLEEPNTEAHDAKLGKLAAGMGIDAVYFLTDNLAVGVSAMNDFFDKRIASGVAKEVSTNIFNVMFLTRYYFNPQDKVKLYVPLAVGMANTAVTIEMLKDEKFYYTGFAAHIGAGVEYYIKNGVSLGAEVLYRHNVFHDSKYTSEGNYVALYPRTNYISYSLRLLKKF